MFMHAAHKGYQNADRSMQEKNIGRGDKEVTKHEEGVFWDCQDNEHQSLLVSEEQRALQEFKMQTEKDLSHYILMHCAKVELSLIDLGTGEMIFKDEEPKDLSENSMMTIIVR